MTQDRPGYSPGLYQHASRDAPGMTTCREGKLVMLAKVERVGHGIRSDLCITHWAYGTAEASVRSCNWELCQTGKEKGACDLRTPRTAQSPDDLTLVENISNTGPRDGNDTAST